MMDFCKDVDAFYIDTVAEPWPGFYNDKKASGRSARTTRCARRCSTCARRRARRHHGSELLRRQSRHGVVVRQAGAARCCADLKRQRRASRRPARNGAGLMQRCGVKGIHIAERDTQRARKSPKPRGVFVNTWSVEGFVSEGLQPAELGWGTHEKALPANARTHDFGCDAAIYLMQPGAGHARAHRGRRPRRRAVRLSRDPQRVDLDRRLFLRRAMAASAVYRPTCHYAYHPCGRRGALAARDVRDCRQVQEKLAHSRRERNRRRHR